MTPPQVSLLPLLTRYIERDPAEAARIVETLDEPKAVAVVKALPPVLCAKIFSHLLAGHASAILQDVPPETMDTIIERIKPEQAAAILVSFPKEKRKSLLDRLPTGMKHEILDILSFPDGSAGRIMSTKFIAFDQYLTVKEAIERIRAMVGRYGPSTYTYVIDGDGRLAGVLNMRDLMLAPSHEEIRNVMQKNVFAVDGFTDREEVARQLAERNYFAAPVIDGDKKLIGVVKMEQLVAQIQEEGTEDILKMVGAGRDERATSSILFSLSKRLPWLTVNLATAFLAASVVALFEDIIARITILAVFLPVVAGQGGNAGAQSLAVVMRGLVMREIRPSQALRLISKEGAVGMLNGVATGLLTAGIAWIWHENPYLGLVVGLAMIVNLTAAGLSGAAIPLAMKALGWDPAQSSSIIQTTVTDVVGFFSFLGFAVVFQRHLIP